MKDIFAQLITALQYTHAQGFAHRDIKLENILIDSKGEILLTDWSLCTRWKPGQMHKDYVGSSAYMSPEVMDGKPYEVRCFVVSLARFSLARSSLALSSRSRSSLTWSLVCCFSLLPLLPFLLFMFPSRVLSSISGVQESYSTRCSSTFYPLNHPPLK